MTTHRNRSHSRFAFAALAVALSAGIACGGNSGGKKKQTGRTLDIAVCDSSGGPFSLDVTNQYFPMPVGRVLVLDGEEDGEQVQQTITVLNEIEVVAGVTTRVVEELETIDGELVEISRNFFAQAPDGTICYFGEDVQDFEEGQVVSNEGEWRAGIDGARPGIFLPADPRVGDKFQQEVAPRVAEDEAEVVGLGGSVTVPAGTFTNVLDLLETTPLEPGATSVKAFAPGAGVVIDEALQLRSFN